MARNHLEEQLEAIKNQKSMLNWKKSMTDDIVEIKQIEDKLDELKKDEIRTLRDLGVFE